MSAYWAILSARFRTLLQYRAAAVAGLGTQLFWGLIRVMIFGAFYHSTTAKQPMSYYEVVAYVWLGQAMFWMLPWNADKDVSAMVRSGTVVYELLRPVDLYALWYSRAIAMRTAPALLRAVPMLLLAGLFFGLKPPPTIACTLAYAGAMVGALLLSCAITALLSISLLWTVSGEGLSRLLAICVWMFSGMIIPLPLYPKWAQSVMYILPFRGVADTPYRLYTGNIPPGDAMALIAHQLLWAAVLIMLGRWILARGLRRMVVHGG